MKKSETHIVKFGGTSLKNADFIQQAVEIISDRGKSARPVVVVSAIEGVTNDLITLAEDPGNSGSLIDRLREKHLGIFDHFVSKNGEKRKELIALFDELHAIRKESSESGKYFDARKDRILSTGERASALILASALSESGIAASAFNASQFIKTDSIFGQAGVDAEESRRLIKDFLDNLDAIPVVTGFIGSDRRGRITTLGRSGSDYTAGLISDALDADHLEIWTDVNGVLSADPDWVPAAESISELSFSDISELSAHGAKVIHPKTIQPIQNKDTSVLVKNSYNPTHPGTRITSGFHSNGQLKTITVTGPFIRLQLENKFALPLFQKLNSWKSDNADAEAFSIHSASEFEPARFLLKKSFFDKIDNHLATWAQKENVVLDLENDLYKVKKFSNELSAHESLTEKALNLFNENDISPISVNRNRGDRFISFLFRKKDVKLAARLMNDQLQSDKKTVNLFVAGTGAVGETLLEQLNELESKDIRYKLIGICNSRRAIWDQRGIDLGEKPDWDTSAPTNWDTLRQKLTEPELHNVIFIDATGSSQVARLYPDLLKNGVHIVTPSKLANTFEQSFYDDLQELQSKNNSSFRYETTVGAGLPVISTITDLKASGDEITEIAGVVSGTMTYLFNELENGTSFSNAVIDARENGYAEPDPRDDLSGEDVARKFLTLARTLGLKIERDQIEVESLIPEDLKDVDKETFLEKLNAYDDSWEKRIQSAEKEGKALRYTGKLEGGNISIGIQEVPKDSPIGQLKGTDNLIQIFSMRYHKTPLIIHGPGAGREVTAAGVLADVLKTAKSF